LTAARHLALIDFVFSGALRRKCPQCGGNTLLQPQTALASKVGKEGVGHASDGCLLNDIDTPAVPQPNPPTLRETYFPAGKLCFSAPLFLGETP